MPISASATATGQRTFVGSERSHCCSLVGAAWSSSRPSAHTRSTEIAVRTRHCDLGVGFAEVYVATPIEICEKRDAKGLYVLARAGQIADFTGISASYEPPLSPELTLSSAETSARKCSELVIEVLESIGAVPGCSSPPSRPKARATNQNANQGSSWRREIVRDM